VENINNNSNNSNNNNNSNNKWKETVKFHGHSCPGLAIGYKVAQYVRKYYAPSEDEELVAIVENNSCSVDAIQYILSCTFGKGNLIFKDNGKQVYTIYYRANTDNSKNNNKAIRIYVKDIFFKDLENLKEKYNKNTLTEEEKNEFIKIKKENTNKILNAHYKDILDIKEVNIPTPKKAKLFNSIVCENCGELFMEIKGRVINGKVVCKECFEKLLNY